MVGSSSTIEAQNLLDRLARAFPVFGTSSASCTGSARPSTPHSVTRQHARRKDYGVYEGTTFKTGLFAGYLADNRIAGRGS